MFYNVDPNDIIILNNNPFFEINNIKEDESTYLTTSTTAIHFNFSIRKKTNVDLTALIKFSSEITGGYVYLISYFIAFSFKTTCDCQQ